jgi:nuclear GTP-binding protein
LKRARVCNVGATPGQTKCTQEIHLDKLVRLLDSPGIIFSKPSKDEAESSAAVLRNCVKVELVTDPIAPVAAILKRCKREQLMQLYALPFFETPEMFLVLVAKKKGRIGKGGVPDLESAARCVLQDWNAGRIPYYCMPPAPVEGESCHIDASMVQGWAKEFDLDSVDGPMVVEMDNSIGVKRRGEMGMVLACESGGINEDELMEYSSEEEMEEEMIDEESEEDDEEEEMSE